MGRRRGVAQLIRRRPRFPYAAGILGNLLARVTKENSPIKPVLMDARIFNIPAAKLPFRRGPQGPHLRMRGSATYAAGNIHIAQTQIRVLIPSGYPIGLCLFSH